MAIMLGLRLFVLAQIRPSEAADQGEDCLYLDCEVASSPWRHTRCFSQSVWAEQTGSGSNTHGHFSWAHTGGKDREVWISLESWDAVSPHSHPANLLKGFPPVFVSLPTMSDLKKDTG